MDAEVTGKDDLATGRPLWDNMLLCLLHPTQLLIIEALRHVEHPLSPSLLVEVLDEEISLGLLDYHCKRLTDLGILEKKSRRPARGSAENFYGFLALPQRETTEDSNSPAP